jgi:hypothetical protein
MDTRMDHYRSGVFRLMKKDKRKELEERVNEAMKDIHDKGMDEGRGEEYQKRQLEWWKECDKAMYG